MDISCGLTGGRGALGGGEGVVYIISFSIYKEKERKGGGIKEGGIYDDERKYDQYKFFLPFLSFDQ